MRPRVPRPAPVILSPEDDIPTSVGARSTFRPPPRIALPEDMHEAYGRIMGAVGNTDANLTQLHAMVSSHLLEYRTFASTLIHVHKCTDELRAEVQALTKSQDKTGKTVGMAAKITPALIVMVEIVRRLIDHYIGG